MSDPDHPLDPGSLPPGPAPTEGEYVGTTWGPGIAVAWVVGVLGLSVWLIVRVLAYDFAEFAEWLPESSQLYLQLLCIAFVLVFGALVAQSVPFILKRLAWDTNGLEFTPLWGKRHRFTWDEVLSLDLPPTGWAAAVSKQTNAYLRLTASKLVEIDPDGSGYNSLVQAMTAHHKVWEAVQARASAEEGDESAWDGVHAPAEGRYQAPWWLLPSRLAIALVAAWLSYHLLCHALVANEDRPPWYLREYQIHAVLVAVVAAIFVAVEGIRRSLTRTVRLVRWEPDGFWLGSYASAPRFHRWEEIASVRSPSGERLGNTILALQSGERAALTPKGHGFETLLAALERHAKRIG